MNFVLHGYPVSGGITVGYAHLVATARLEVAHYEVAADAVEAEIINKLGLHARAAAKLTHVASGFQSDIWISRSGRRVNAKSIMGVMMLAAGRGTKVMLQAEGGDADAALKALTALIADKFGEGE